MTDYMNEVERLLEQYDDACLGIIGMSEEQARAAMIAHIQRGAVPEGWQVVPKEPTREMCRAGLAERHDDLAKSIYTAMIAAAPAPDQFRDATKMMAEPAEVPMPEPVAYLYTLEYGETVAGRRLSEHQLNYPFGVCGSDYLAQTDDGVSYVRQTPLYTKDAEAAGYARGLADERERICAAIKAEDDYCVTEVGYMLDSEDCISVARRTWERPDYSLLRGEVKP